MIIRENESIKCKYKNYSDSKITSSQLLNGLKEANHEIYEEFGDRIQVVIHNGSFPTEFQLVKKLSNQKPEFS